MRSPLPLPPCDPPYKKTGGGKGFNREKQKTKGRLKNFNRKTGVDKHSWKTEEGGGGGSGWY